MENVGVRELKTHLGRYLRAVRRGETIIVTARGKPLARLVPTPSQDKTVMPKELAQRMWELGASGLLTWSGGPFQVPEPVAVNKGPGLLSDLVVEGRE